MNPPLAEKLRPQNINEVFGQNHLTGQDGMISKIIARGYPISILLWGPPGSGKTTLAKLYARGFNAKFISFSAVFQGVRDLREIIADLKAQPLLKGRAIVFVDEIHRFNKAQQDAFLPYLEDGTLTMVGATTENPSFALNNALLSRLRVLELRSLDHEALHHIVQRFETKTGPLKLTAEARAFLIKQSHGDGRHLMNMLENIITFSGDKMVDLKEISHLVQKRPPLYDRESDQHYNLISALHKSIRSSDPDAALYYLARMLNGGEDPQYLLRRLARIALEDIGLADPDALTHATSAWETFRKLGTKEGELALAQLTVYLALSPKSNSIYKALAKAKESAERTSSLPPPSHIIDGQGYIYDHDTQGAFSGQNHFPDQLEREEYYEPRDWGFEREMKKRLSYFKKKRSNS